MMIMKIHDIDMQMFYRNLITIVGLNWCNNFVDVLKLSTNFYDIFWRVKCFISNKPFNLGASEEQDSESGF